MRSLSATSTLAACVISASQLSAQSASVEYRLGADTVAIEQFTRTATKLTGEMVQRSGAAVVRVNYDMTLGSDGRLQLVDGSVTTNKAIGARGTRTLYIATVARATGSV